MMVPATTGRKAVQQAEGYAKRTLPFAVWEEAGEKLLLQIFQSDTAHGRHAGNHYGFVKDDLAVVQLSRN